MALVKQEVTSFVTMILLTHLSLDKVTAISQTNEKFCVLIELSLKFVPRSPIGNNPVTV